ncbi:30S ribosomal protein S20 [Aerococcaceae bacterium WGS1372]
MANTKSALKRVRQDSVKEQRNTSQVSKMRSLVKDLRKAVETGEGDVNELFAKASKQIDRVAGKGLIHVNKANRDKAKLAKLISK